MFLRIAPVASVALLALGIFAEPAVAAPGDTVIPAHRTRNGAYVPPSVPPMSAGTRLAARPPKASKAPLADDHSATTGTLVVPLFAAAKPIRR
jgi:hypothetical protein